MKKFFDEKKFMKKNLRKKNYEKKNHKKNYGKKNNVFNNIQLISLITHKTKSNIDLSVTFHHHQSLQSYVYLYVQ